MYHSTPKHRSPERRSSVVCSAPSTILLAIFVLVLFAAPADLQAQQRMLKPNVNYTSNKLNIITGIYVAPDGEVYFLEKSTEAFTHSWLSHSVPYYNLYHYDLSSGFMELIATKGGSTPPEFLPGGTPIFSINNFRLDPFHTLHQNYFDYADSLQREGEFDFTFTPGHASSAMNSNQFFVLGTENIPAEWFDYSGVLWIRNLDGSIDQRYQRPGGVADVAIDDDSSIYFSQIGMSQEGELESFFMVSDDLGENFIQQNDRFVTRNFVLTEEHLLIAEGNLLDGPVHDFPYAVTADGIYTSTDRGVTWKLITEVAGETGLPPVSNSMGSFAIGLADFSNGSPLYRLIQLDAMGEVVENLALDMGGKIVRLYGSDSALYMLLENGTIQSSSDGGKTWRALDFPWQVTDMVLLDDGTIVVTDSYMLYHLTDIITDVSGESMLLIRELNLH